MDFLLNYRLTVNLIKRKCNWQMKNFNIVFLVLACCLVSACSVETPSIPESNNIRSYLIQKASFISDSSLSGIHTLGDWQNIRNKRYHELAEMLSWRICLWPEMVSPQCKNYRYKAGRGYHIENLIMNLFRGSMSGQTSFRYLMHQRLHPYVCGIPSIPESTLPGSSGTLPAGIYIWLLKQLIRKVRSHWGHTRRWSTVQLWLQPEVWKWNGIRGLDLLTSRSEVDGETGCNDSGGGSQSWYIVAMDPASKLLCLYAVQAHWKLRSPHVQSMAIAIVWCPQYYGQDFADIKTDSSETAPDLPGWPWRVNIIESVRSLITHR
jgi:hypothetical protein